MIEDRLQKIFVFSILFLAGCASLPVEREEAVFRVPQERYKARVALSKGGVYHKVRAGETLWRIAKTYNVSIKDIVTRNRISDATKIEKGQRLFIPGVARAEKIVLETKESQKEFVWPVKGKVISYFRHRMNKGIDIRCAPGETVKASRTGRVVFADYFPGYGHTVILDHVDGFHSVYARNVKLLVKLGDLVLKNTDIATLAKAKNRANLHFEIRKKSREDNPLFYLP